MLSNEISQCACWLTGDLGIEDGTPRCSPWSLRREEHRASLRSLTAEGQRRRFWVRGTRCRRYGWEEEIVFNDAQMLPYAGWVVTPNFRLQVSETTQFFAGWLLMPEIRGKDLDEKRPGCASYTYEPRNLPRLLFTSVPL